MLAFTRSMLMLVGLISSTYKTFHALNGALNGAFHLLRPNSHTNTEAKRFADHYIIQLSTRKTLWTIGFFLYNSVPRMRIDLLSVGRSENSKYHLSSGALQACSALFKCEEYNIADHSDPIQCVRSALSFADAISVLCWSLNHHHFCTKLYRKYRLVSRLPQNDFLKGKFNFKNDLCPQTKAGVHWKSTRSAFLSSFQFYKQTLNREKPILHISIRVQSTSK